MRSGWASGRGGRMGKARSYSLSSRASCSIHSWRPTAKSVSQGCAGQANAGDAVRRQSRHCQVPTVFVVTLNAERHSGKKRPTMNFYELVNARYSIREYKDEVVPEDTVRRILEAAVVFLSVRGQPAATALLRSARCPLPPAPAGRQRALEARRAPAGHDRRLQQSRQALGAGRRRQESRRYRRCDSHGAYRAGSHRRGAWARAGCAHLTLRLSPGARSACPRNWSRSH